MVGDRNLRWRNVIIHEIAHQWFGNAVTESDWDDVWLSEGFATYFTLLFIEHQYGHDAFIDGLASSKKRIISFNEKNPNYRIVHNNLGDMNQVTSSHTYQKGSWTLHMLRGLMGTETFWKGIRSYYAKYQNKNATTTDFKREMEEASGLDLGQFFEQWLYKSGHLICDGYWKYNDKKKEVTVTLDQVQKDGSLFAMPIQVEVYLSGDEKPILKTIQLNSRSNTLTFSVESAPEKVLLDPNFLVLMESSFVKK